MVWWWLCFRASAAVDSLNNRSSLSNGAGDSGHTISGAMLAFFAASGAWLSVLSSSTSRLYPS